MVTANTRTNVPTRGRPVSALDEPENPSRLSVVSPKKVPVMKTLKWAKLISSIIP
jgi:hypothetical protein